ncbi:sensor histidine kinase [Nonomuraea jiangxiensis]|uniref:histidine kinase n=1 Tax=Nonomuraea jiangxiensis TaxID=633440 RepID=A0A1G9B1H3_9ACTN|nr:HAMP domain-containing sensor histidine kinase [Nonomuraea jiangxiensis]SDK33382.1 two-component system, OmpR family, sensor histidine kinase MprB [Nonomuraea jiangxiensis]
MKLRTRVGLAGAAVVAAALLAASLVLYPAAAAGLAGQHDGELVLAAGQVPRMLQSFKIDGAPLPTSPVEVGNTLLQLVPPPVVAGATPDFVPLTSRDVDVAHGADVAYFQEATHAGVRYRIYTAQLAQVETGLVRAAFPLDRDAATLGRLGLLLAVLTLGGAAIAGAGARLAAGRVLSPIGHLTAAVERITATRTLTAGGLDTGGRDEVARLARSFTTMTGALQESLLAQRRLVADASHELRTPLTSLITNLELLEEGRGTADPQAPALVHEARVQAGELRALVNDLVELARHGDSQIHTEDVRLDLLAGHAVARATARAPRVKLRAELAECLVRADPDAVERAVANLVDNAIKWSPPGGEVVVRVTPPGTLSVTDQGPGIAPQDLPFVFDRFYRADAARALPGSGLGLAIVRQIAEAHGGTVRAEPLQQGVRLLLTLPAAT